MREPELGPVPARAELCNCLLSALSVFLSLLSSSAQNTDSFTVSGARLSSLSHTVPFSLLGFSYFVLFAKTSSALEGSRTPIPHLHVTVSPLPPAAGGRGVSR